MDTMKEKYAGTQAVARTFQLINLFTDEQPVWSLSALITASGLKRTTAFRLLAALEAEGVIRKTDSAEYTLGAELIVLGGRAMRANSLRTVAQPFLTQLVRETTESVTIDVLWVDEENRPKTIVIEEKIGRYLLGMSQYIGGRYPAHVTSTGKALLAWQNDLSHAQISLSPLEKYTPFTITNPNRFEQELTEVKTQGYAITRNELEIGLTAIAAPIFDLHGDAQAALCIGAPTSRIEPRLTKLAQCVMRTAHQISAALGHRTKHD